jgi:hypothetical protein
MHMTSTSNPIDKLTELILELSADAHIQRHEVAKNCPAFHSLTGEIAAYGRVLARIRILQESEELFTFARQDCSPEHIVTAERLSYVA